MHRSLAIAGALAAAVTLAAAVGAALDDTEPASRVAPCPKPPRLPGVFSIRIDNPYFPLVPGTTFTYKGELDGEPGRDVVRVTRATKPTAVGVNARVVRDQVFVRSELVEDTFDWYAQDSAGNVWYFGEDTKELEDGQVASTEGSWEAGVDNARAGMFMPAAPRVGQTFKQEDAKNVAEDCTTIAALDASVKTPFVASGAALRTAEFSLLEPGVLDDKFYVRDVGLVREQTVRGGSDVLELVSRTGP